MCDSDYVDQLVEGLEDENLKVGYSELLEIAGLVNEYQRGVKRDRNMQLVSLRISRYADQRVRVHIALLNGANAVRGLQPVA